MRGFLMKVLAQKIIFFLCVSQSKKNCVWSGTVKKIKSWGKKKEVILHNQWAPSGTINEIPQNSEDQSYWLIKDPEL